MLAMVAAACGGPDPVSTGTSPGTSPDAPSGVAPAGAAGGFSSASEADSPPTVSPPADSPEDPVPSTMATTTVSRDRPVADAVPTDAVTDAVPTDAVTDAVPPDAVTDAVPTDAVAASPIVFVDDEPTFDVEPLAPFVDLDILPTGWAAFDFFLSDALIRNGNTAASVAVSIGGTVVHRAAMGERTPLSGDRAEIQDRFRIASISKTLTAISLLQLVEEGVVDLDEPIGRLVAEHVGVSDPSGAIESITTRQLLNHTAGFGKYRSVFFGGQSTDCLDAARIGLGRSPTSTPGGTYRYSNMNYCVAGQLIEALTGNDYDDVVYERVLAPLGIVGPRLAATFDPGPDEILHPTTLGRNYMETLGAAGAWIATPEDLVRVLDALDPTTPGHKPLEAATLEMMKTPVGGSRGQRGYGLGLLLYGGERYGHTGTIEATHAMAMNRGDGVTWAITVSGPYPDDTPQLESIINRAFEAGGFVAG